MSEHGATMLYKDAADLRRAAMAAETVCFFGLGTLFEDCFSQLVQVVGQRPDVLCDNAPQKWGRAYHGIPCVSPGELPERRDSVLILICMRQYEKVFVQLTGMGFSNLFLVNFERAYHRVGSIRRVEKELATGEGCMLSLQGRWGFVTGASRGIGRQIALALAELGVNLVIHGRSLAGLEDVEQACRTLGVDVLPVAADLGHPESLETLLEWLRDAAPPIDMLFNNAGISPSDTGDFWQMPPGDFYGSYAVNLLAPVRLCQQLIPPMIKRGFGRVVSVSSSIQKRPGEMAYACSKAALDKFIFDLQPELEGTGVMASQVDPGWLRTDMGGMQAPNAVDSVFPGALLGAVIDGDVSGSWFAAQDYAGMSIEEAVAKAFFIGACKACEPITKEST